MTIRNKLATSSTLLFAVTVGAVLLGTFVIFKHLTHDLYYNRLLERANTVAYFYFEKDEVTEKSFKNIEIKFLRISTESIRVYKLPQLNILVHDSIPQSIPTDILSEIQSSGNKTFDMQGRQFAGLYYKDNQGDFIIVVSGIDMTGTSQLASLKNLFLIFFFTSIPIQFLLSSYLAKRTFRPLSLIIKKVNNITSENLHSRLNIELHTKDELQELAITFNYFLERLEKSVTIQNNFVKNASHELRTPLTIIIGEIEVALNYPKQIDEYEALLRSLKKDALHFKSVLEGLLVLSGLEISQNREMKPVSIDEIIWSALEKKTLEYPAARISVNFEQVTDPGQFMIKGNRELLFVSLSNILDNAIKFSSPGNVQVNAGIENGVLRLSIFDNGVGISAAEQEQMFELFYRSNRTRNIQGQGIGLYITRHILDLHGITLKINSAEQAGTEVILVFPKQAD